MKNIIKYLFIFLLTFSFDIYTQVIDSSIISQLSPEQIQMAKDVYAGQNYTYSTDEELPILDESLIAKDNVEDANDISGKKYGYDFFSATPTSLTAVGDLPLPNDYKISLRDQFTVILSGSKDAIFDLNVKLDGTILFPELGAISVVGLSLQEVKDKLSLLAEQSYIGVNIDISLQNLSAKKITIVGAVKTPGTYLINPFSTITGALAYSGGISEIGSLRDIKLIRNNKEFYSFDLYDLLIRGDRSNDLTIEAGDTLLVNAASQFVEINGDVKRPAIYEIKEGETLKDALEFALGFNQTANKSNISVSFLDLKKASVVKKNINNLNHSLQNALAIEVFNYVSEDNSNIQVFGAVEQPGFYDIKKYKNLEDLIANLNFVNAYPWLGVLEQFDEDKLLKSTVLFSLKDSSTYKNIKLMPNSKIYFANIYDRTFPVSEETSSLISDSELSEETRSLISEYKLSEETSSLISDYELSINHKQKNYRMPVFGKFTVSSFVDLLGLDMSDVDNKATYVSPLEDIVLNSDYKDMQFTAQKYNTISFRSPTNNLISVKISGAVEFPGTYQLNDNSTIEDLYQLVGEFKSQAYLEGISLTREGIRERQIKAIEIARDNLNKAALLSSQSGEALDEVDITQALSETIDPVNLGRLAGNFSPKSSTALDTMLFDGDTIFVPKNPNSIIILGEVLNPVAIEHTEEINLQSAINKAGGFQEYADKRKVYIIKANGMVQRGNRNIFVKNVNLEPGDTIVVPRKIIIQNPALKALVPFTNILSDLAFSAAALDNLSSN